jgi:acetyl-CoA carboxylase biotin carboxyl carrier protein
MNQKELKELIEFLIEKDIAEFELERGDVKVRIKRAAEPAAAPQNSHFFQVSPPPALPPPLVETPQEEPLHTITSPIVGTYYESPSPGSPPFVKPGDPIEVGQVLCIIEAMKLMNEIESDAAGELVKMFITNGQPVEYGQPLFAVRPRK